MALQRAALGPMGNSDREASGDAWNWVISHHVSREGHEGGKMGDPGSSCSGATVLTGRLSGCHRMLIIQTVGIAPFACVSGSVTKCFTYMDSLIITTVLERGMNS